MLCVCVLCGGRPKSQGSEKNSFAKKENIYYLNIRLKGLPSIQLAPDTWCTLWVSPGRDGVVFSCLTLIEVSINIWKCGMFTFKKTLFVSRPMMVPHPVYVMMNCTTILSYFFSLFRNFHKLFFNFRNDNKKDFWSTF